MRPPPHLAIFTYKVPSEIMAAVDQNLVCLIGGWDGEHSGVGFMDIYKVVGILMIFVLKQYHFTECSQKYDTKMQDIVLLENIMVNYLNIIN